MKILFVSPSIFMSNRFAKMIFAPRELALTTVEGLVQRGHEVTFASSPDTKTSAQLLAGDQTLLDYYFNYCKQENIPSAVKQQTLFLIKRDYEIDLMTKVVENIKKNPFDIVHAYHKDLQHYFLNSVTKAQVVYTIHDPLPKKDNLAYLLFDRFSKHNYISISDSQTRGQPKLHFLGTVYHGVDISHFKFEPKPDRYFLFMGRLTPEKGLQDAVLAIKKAAVHLKIGASMPDAKHETEFYKKAIKPCIHNSLISIPGIVSVGQKRKLYQKAKALLFPISWEEPFGIVMIEAMASGTPVIAYNRGSVPEIIKDGVTGFIIDQVENKAAKGRWLIKKTGVEGLVEAIERIGEIDRNACRKHVSKHFTSDMMVAGYEKIYETLIRRKNIETIYEGSSHRV